MSNITNNYRMGQPIETVYHIAPVFAGRIQAQEDAWELSLGEAGKMRAYPYLSFCKNAAPHHHAAHKLYGALFSEFCINMLSQHAINPETNK